MQAISNHKKTINKNFSDLNYILLCAYLASIAIGYMEFMPKDIDSVMLYVFAISSIAMVTFSRSLRVYTISKWYVIFIIVSAIGLIYTPAKTTGPMIFTDMLKILLFITLASNVINSKERIRGVFFSLSISVFLLYLYLQISGKLITDEVRFGGELTGNANTFATVFMVGAISSVYLIFSSKKNYYKVFWIAILICQEYSLALSGGRKFFILPIVLLLATYLMNTKNKIKVIIRIIIVCIAVYALSYAIMNVQFLYDSIGYRFDGLIIGVNTGHYDASAQNRVKYINEAIKFWMSSPIWGHGTDAFQNISGAGCYSHNNFVELLCNLGLMGFLAYYFYYFLAIKKAIKSSSSKKNFWIVMLVCLLIFDYGAVSYYMYHVLTLFVLILAGIEYD